MNPKIVIGIAIVAALLVPAASAHIIVAAPDAKGNCQVIEIGRPNTAPHGAAWVEPCGPIFHTGSVLP